MSIERLDEIAQRTALEHATKVLYEELERVGFARKAFAIVVVEPRNGTVLWYSSNTKARAPLLRAVLAWIKTELGS
jgi:hypothetical protein